MRHIHVHAVVKKARETPEATYYSARLFLIDFETGEILRHEKIEVKGSDIRDQTVGVGVRAAKQLYNPEKITTSTDFLDVIEKPIVITV